MHETRGAQGLFSGTGTMLVRMTVWVTVRYLVLRRKLIWFEIRIPVLVWASRPFAQRIDVVPECVAFLTFDKWQPI